MVWNRIKQKNKKMFYIPVGFAHGFLTLEDDTEFQYNVQIYMHHNMIVG